MRAQLAKLQLETKEVQDKMKEDEEEEAASKAKEKKDADTKRA